jgi:uncharacterized membrane protein YobD (UPF0266 family)
MNVCKIKVCSRIVYSLTFWAIALGGTFLGFHLGEKGDKDVYIFVLAVCALTALVFVPNLLSTATIEWTFADEEMRIKWLSGLVLFKNRDLNIKVRDIEEYKYEPTRYFDLLKIKLYDQRS